MSERHAIYRVITAALHEGRLQEPFTAQDCTELIDLRLARLSAFLARHREGNPLGCKVFFRQVERAKYRMITSPLLSGRKEIPRSR